MNFSLVRSLRTKIERLYTLGTQFPITIVSSKHIILSTLIYLNEARGNCCPPLSFDLPAIRQSSTADTGRRRVSRVTTSCSESCTRQLLTATSKGAISILTTYRISSPDDRQPTPHHHWQASLTCLFDRPLKRGSR